MDEHEIKQVLEEVNRKLDRCDKKLNNGGSRWLVGGIWTLIVGLAAVIIMGIYNYGRQEERILQLEESRIDKTEWRYNDYFTRYLWAERWTQELPDPPYKTRGIAPNI